MELLRRWNLLPHVVHWSDARFGVVVEQGQVTRQFSLRGPDAVTTPGVAGPRYVAQGYNGHPEIRYDQASLQVPLLDLSHTNQYTTLWLGQQRTRDTIGFFYELSRDYNQSAGGMTALIENNQLEVAHHTTDFVVIRDAGSYQQQPLYVVTRGDFTRSSEEINVRMNEQELTEYSYGTTPYNRDTTGPLRPDVLYLGARGGNQFPLRNGLLNSLLILDVAVSDEARGALQQFLRQQYTPVLVPQNGLQAWFQAERGAQFNQAGQLTSWTDQSGNGMDLTPTDGSAVLSAEQLNAHPMIRVSGRLASTKLCRITGNSARSVYFLGRLVEGNVVLSWGEANTGRLFECAQEGNSPFIHAYGEGMDNLNTLGSQPVLAPALWTWRYDGEAGGYSEFNDQVGAKGGPPYMNTPGTPLFLAWGGYYGPSVVDFLEVLVYDRFVTGPEHEQIRAYLGAKGAVPVRSAADGAVPSQQLQGWWRADTGVEVDADGFITQWTDQSVHARHLMPEAAGILNLDVWAGRTAIRFTGGPAFLPFALPELAPAVYTVLLVLQKQAGQDNMMPIAFGRSSEEANDLWANYNCFGLNNFNDNIYGLRNASDFLHQPILVTAELYHQDSSSFRLWLNGQPQQVAPVINTTVDRPLSPVFRVGGSVFLNSGSYLWNGWIAEVILYDRTLEQVERDELHANLLIKYGISGATAPSQS
ncbi:hypothetical protein ACFSX6_21335 [Hymenobacter rubripertinctus]